MLGAINRFYRHECGATATEYAMLIVFIARYRHRRAGSAAVWQPLTNIGNSRNRGNSQRLTPLGFRARHKLIEINRRKAGHPTPKGLGAELFRSDLWNKLD